MSLRFRAFPRASVVLSIATLMVSTSTAGELHVQFVEPARYTDASLTSYGSTDERVLRLLEQHLQGLAECCLDDGETLHIRVFNIDLAGQREWWHRTGARNVRVMREITWPRMHLAYTLRHGNGVVIESKERISDMDYLLHSAYVRADSVPLPYERAMLTRWFTQTFCR